jgi:hypothetical protein
VCDARGGCRDYRSCRCWRLGNRLRWCPRHHGWARGGS